MGSIKVIFVSVLFIKQENNDNQPGFILVQTSLSV